MMVACGVLVSRDERQSAGLKPLHQKLLRLVYASLVASMVVTLRDAPGLHQAGALEHRQVPRNSGLRDARFCSNQVHADPVFCEVALYPRLEVPFGIAQPLQDLRTSPR